MRTDGLTVKWHQPDGLVKLCLRTAHRGNGRRLDTGEPLTPGSESVTIALTMLPVAIEREASQRLDRLQMQLNAYRVTMRAVSDA